MNRTLQKPVHGVHRVHRVHQVQPGDFDSEKVNFWTHIIGLLIAITASVFLLREALAINSTQALLGISIFCVVSINLFFASVICHSRFGRQSKHWTKYDHCAIYLFIAGTFTPMCLFSSLSAWPWFALGVMWVATAILINKEINSDVQNPPSTLVYLAVGWIGIALALPLIRSFDFPSIAYCVIGAILYSVGTVFYRRSDRWRLAHGTWHTFVVGGTVAHFLMFHSILSKIKVVA